MENRRHLLGVFVMMLLGLAFVAATAIAQGEGRRSPYFSNEKLYQFETNLIVAIQSGFPGLETSAAQTLRELKVYNPDFSFSRSIIPLMRIVKSENAHTQSRICAALTLHDLRSDCGDFAIARTAKFSENTKIKKLCYWLAYTRQAENRQIVVNTNQEAVVMVVR
jgi:hypothetical protein